MRAHAAERATAAASLAAISTGTAATAANGLAQPMSLLTKVGLRGLWCVRLLLNYALPLNPIVSFFKPIDPLRKNLAA